MHYMGHKEKTMRVSIIQERSSKREGESKQHHLFTYNVKKCNPENRCTMTLLLTFAEAYPVLAINIFMQ